MNRYLVLKGGSKTFKFKVSGEMSIIADGMDEDGTITWQIESPDEGLLKEMNLMLSYAFKGGKDGKE